MYLIKASDYKCVGSRILCKGHECKSAQVSCTKMGLFNQKFIKEYHTTLCSALAHACADLRQLTLSMYLRSDENRRKLNLKICQLKAVGLCHVTITSIDMVYDSYDGSWPRIRQRCVASEIVGGGRSRRKQNVEDDQRPG